MIVVEGMDGAGKTGLIKRLSADLQIPIHKRASSSVGGPVANLYEWVEKDVRTMRFQEFSIYDRHPLVSEYVYGPIVRGDMDPRFHTEEGSALSILFWHSVFVVFCDPGLEQIERNVQSTEHMPGVTEHWERLYWSYKSLMHYWPGQAMTWDYRYQATLYPTIRSRCVEFMALKKEDTQR